MGGSPGGTCAVVPGRRRKLSDRPRIGCVIELKDSRSFRLSRGRVVAFEVEESGLAGLCAVAIDATELVFVGPLEAALAPKRNALRAPDLLWVTFLSTFSFHRLPKKCDV